MNPDRPNRSWAKSPSYNAGKPQLPGFNHEAFNAVTRAGDTERSNAYLQQYATQTGTPVESLRRVLFDSNGGLR